MTALKRFPRDPDGAVRELQAQFSNNGTKVLLRKQIMADLQTLRTRVENHRCRGALFAETYNQLNAFFATFPGNYAHNLRRLYLLNSNYADLSFLFTIHPGETTNAHLGSEYLAILETNNAASYFLNLHNGEVAHTMVIGMTGSGKTTLLNALTDFIPESERIVVIEDTRELRIAKPHILTVECQTDSHTGTVNFNDLLKGALRWRPETKLTRAEEGELYRAAKSEGKYAAEWAGEVLLREARRTKEDAVFTELIAMRVLLNNVLRPVALGQKMSPEHFNEVLANVRAEKRKAAQKVMQQYTRIERKEQ